jgi:hypothetical protein
MKEGFRGQAWYYIAIIQSQLLKRQGSGRLPFGTNQSKKLQELISTYKCSMVLGASGGISRRIIV